jgi:putative colanic acid biosynthesis acetyltransferase WcaF
MKVDFKLFDNGWYYPGKGFLIRAIWYIVNAIIFNSYIFPFYKPKALILKLFGSKVGCRLVIKPKVNIKYPWNLTIGDDVWIGEHVWIDSLTYVQIGSNVCISQNSVIMTGSHNYKLKTFDLILAPVIIEDGAWICAGAYILPGAVLRSHSVILPCSIISKAVDPYTIYNSNSSFSIRQRIIES